MRIRAFLQECYPRDCQEIVELRRIRCAEADRARHLKIDELSLQQREKSFYRESACESVNQAKFFKAHAVPQGLLRKAD